MKIRVLSVVHDTTVDGPGFRTSIYCAGCGHHCVGCHNPQSWDFMGGEEQTVDGLLKEIVNDPFANVTFTGGDPFYQSEAFAELARHIHAETSKTIWAYTGFLFEDLLRHPAKKALLEQLDVLVDGPFVESLRNSELLFCGSSNQRLINVPESLAQDKVVLWKRNDFEV